jgi:exonuclease VII large subunit
MPPKQEILQEMEQKLSHQLSMQIMEVGQTILELEARYHDSFSRQMKDKIQRAKDILDELAKDCMTELTSDRMKNWQKESAQEREKYNFTRKKDIWESLSPGQELEYQKRLIRRMHQGFGR